MDKYQQHEKIFYDIYSDVHSDRLYMTWCGPFTFGYFWCRGCILWFNPDHVRVFDDEKDITKNMVYDYENHTFDQIERSESDKINNYLDSNALRFDTFDNLYETLNNSFPIERFIKLTQSPSSDDWLQFHNLLCSNVSTYDIEKSYEFLYEDDRLFSFDAPLQMIVEEIKLVQKIQEQNGVTFEWI